MTINMLLYLLGLWLALGLTTTVVVNGELHYFCPFDGELSLPALNEYVDLKGMTIFHADENVARCYYLVKIDSLPLLSGDSSQDATSVCRTSMAAMNASACAATTAAPADLMEPKNVPAMLAKLFQDPMYFNWPLKERNLFVNAHWDAATSSFVSSDGSVVTFPGQQVSASGSAPFGMPADNGTVAQNAPVTLDFTDNYTATLELKADDDDNHEWFLCQSCAGTVEVPDTRAVDIALGAFNRMDPADTTTQADPCSECTDSCVFYATTPMP